MFSTTHPTSSFNISKRTNSSLTALCFHFPYLIYSKQSLPLERSSQESTTNELVFTKISISGILEHIYLKLLVHLTYYFKLAYNNMEP